MVGGYLLDTGSQCQRPTALGDPLPSAPGGYGHCTEGSLRLGQGVQFSGSPCRENMEFPKTLASLEDSSSHAEPLGTRGRVVEPGSCAEIRGHSGLRGLGGAEGAASTQLAAAVCAKDQIRGFSRQG